MDKQALIEKLNEDLSNEYGAIVQYNTYAACVTGPYRPQLAAFLSKEVVDEQAHALFLANKIVALGGVPTTKVKHVEVPKTNREMLEEVLKAEIIAVKNYTERAAQAESFGDKGLQVNLEDMVRDEANHVEETERILRDWPL